MKENDSFGPVVNGPIMNDQMSDPIPIHCAHDRMADVTAIVPHPRNPNKHGDKQVALLAKIIRHQGWRSPIVVSKRSGFVIAGHGRLQAALLLGLQSVPVNDQDFTTEADEWAHLVADNRIAELAEMDPDGLRSLVIDLGEVDGFDLDLTGFDADEVAEVTAPEPTEVDAEPQVDKAAELAEKWGVKLGQVWELGDHRLACGSSTDSEAVAKVMCGENAGLCFTSPPYAQQRDYGQKISDWDGLMDGVFLNAPLNSSGQLLVNLGLVHKDGEWWPYWDGWIDRMAQAGWKKFGWYVWDQGPGMPGNWSGRLAPSHEFIWHFNKESVNPEKARECKHAGEAHGGKGQRGKNGKVKDRSAGHEEIQSHAIMDSVFRVNRQGASHGANGHPAPYPVGLPAIAVRSWPGIVYEPFSGSGTTIIACEQLGRKCRAIEIDPGYVAVAIQRWADATGGTPRLLP